MPEGGSMLITKGRSIRSRLGQAYREYPGSFMVVVTLADEAAPAAA